MRRRDPHPVRLSQRPDAEVRILVQPFMWLLGILGVAGIVGSWSGGWDASECLGWGLAGFVLATVLLISAIPEGATALTRVTLRARPEFMAAVWRRRAVIGFGLALLVAGPVGCGNLRAVAGPDMRPFLYGAISAAGLAVLALGGRVMRPRAADRSARQGTAAGVRDPWTRDHPWSAKGVRRTFALYLRSRRRVAGLACAVAAVLLVPVPSHVLHGSAIVFQVLAAILGGMWAITVWRILGMGTMFLGFVRVPQFTGERAEFSFGVSEGGAEMTDVTFVLRRFREEIDPRRGRRGIPLATLVLVEAGGLRPRTFQPGTDQLVAFDVPAGAPGTAIAAASPSYWELEVRGRTREGPFQERFLVPIYARPGPGRAATGPG